MNYISNSIKKDKFLMVSLISIILFNIFFVIIATFYNDIIILVNRFFKPFTREYLDWYINKPSIKGQSFIFNITWIIKIIFSMIFFIEFFYLISNDKYKIIMDKKGIFISLLIGSITYLLSFFLIRYMADHYRLFMTLISTEICSLVILSLIIKYSKKAVSK